MASPRDRLRSRPPHRATPGLVLAAWLALALLGGCRGEERAVAAEKVGTAAAVAPVTVAFAPAVQGSIADYIVGTSTLRASHSADVAAEVQGVVEAIDVEEGAWVEQGRVLARIDYRALALAESKARATRDKTAADLARTQELADLGLVARETLDTARFQADTARIGWSEGQVALEKATVRAPITGVIAERAIRPGDRVAVGAKMFGVVDTRSLEADLHVPERFLDDLHPGQRCLLGTESRGSVAPVDARVLRVAPVVDAGSGTVKVVVALDAPAGDAGLRLRPGQFVRAQLVTRTHENATLVPKRAVVQDDGQPLVFVREGDLARAVPIETGLSDGEHVEVLRGLAPGAEVVVAGQAALSDGTRIQTAAEALAAREGAAETPSTTRGDSASEAGG